MEERNDRVRKRQEQISEDGVIVPIEMYTEDKDLFIVIDTKHYKINNKECWMKFGHEIEAAFHNIVWISAESEISQEDRMARSN